jgi:hypothetical protein
MTGRPPGDHINMLVPINDRNKGSARSLVEPHWWQPPGLLPAPDGFSNSRPRKGAQSGAPLRFGHNLGHGAGERISDAYRGSPSGFPPTGLSGVAKDFVSSQFKGGLHFRRLATTDALGRGLSGLDLVDSCRESIRPAKPSSDNAPMVMPVDGISVSSAPRRPGRTCQRITLRSFSTADCRSD